LTESFSSAVGDGGVGSERLVLLGPELIMAWYYITCEFFISYPGFCAAMV
jgi:hypothetical protein